MAAQTVQFTLCIDGHPVEPELLRALLRSAGEPDSATRDVAMLRDTLNRRGFNASLQEDNSTAGLDEQQAKVLLDAIGEGVCLGDARGRVLWSNAFFRDLDPATRRLVSEKLREAAESFAVELASRNAAGEPSPTPASGLVFEIGSNDDDRILELFVTAAPPRPTFGGDLGEHPSDRERAEARVEREGRDRVAGVVRDITDKRRTAAKFRAIDRAGYELVRLDSAAVRDRNSYERLQLLEDKIVRVFHDVLNYDHFAIFLIDEKRRKLELVISAGLPPEIQDLDLTPETDGNGISGYVAATGESYICRNASTDDRFLPGLIGAQSSLTVPLRIHDRVIGILDIESKHADAFDAAAAQFVEIFARYIALALHMLDLLVVERSTTNTTVSDRVLSELQDPLSDIVKQIEGIESRRDVSSQVEGEARQIRQDVEAIRSRLAEVASGPQRLIGVERAMASCDVDPVLAGKRVLIADDEPKIRKVIGAVLRARGCSVEVCENGALAIEQLNEHAVGASASPFDLVISDIQMPDRNGYEVFSASRKTSPDAPVILMTGFGYDPHHSIVRASQVGLHGVLFKPFDIEQLLAEVRKAVSPPG